MAQLPEDYDPLEEIVYILLQRYDKPITLNNIDDMYRILSQHNYLELMNDPINVEHHFERLNNIVLLLRNDILLDAYAIVEEHEQLLHDLARMIGRNNQQWKSYVQSIQDKNIKYEIYDLPTIDMFLGINLDDYKYESD